MFNLCKLLCVYPDIFLFSHFPDMLLNYKTWLFWGNNTLQSSNNASYVPVSTILLITLLLYTTSHKLSETPYIDPA